MAMPNMREPIETGCPDGFQYLHPTMQKNFGQWKYHTHPRVGVLWVFLRLLWVGFLELRDI